MERITTADGKVVDMSDPRSADIAKAAVTNSINLLLCRSNMTPGSAVA